jgi:transposase
MNSDMFMQWCNERLLPTFHRLYPNKKMVLVCDNAPYHHKREVGSMNNKSKKELLELMTNDKVDWIELPLNTERCEYMDENGAEDVPEGTHFDITDPKDVVRNFGETMGIHFDPEEQKQTANTELRPRVATVDELRTSYMLWLKQNKPEKLECKVERLLRDSGHEILWTPPYCPDLQPIELFWAAGKNWAAEGYFRGRTMRETIKQLREGWYGTIGPISEGEERKVAVDCNKLYNTSIDYANNKFIPMCNGSVTGMIGSLQQDPNYKPPLIDIPIDTLLLDFALPEEEQQVEQQNDEQQQQQQQE